MLILDDVTMDGSNLVIQNDLNKRLDRIRDIINFYNFIYSNQTFKRLNNVFKDYVSINSLIVKKKTISNNNEGIIQKIDIYGNNNLFYVKSSPTFKTSIGGLISFAYFFLIIFSIVFFGFNFWSTRSVRVNSLLSYYEVDDAKDPDVYAILSGPKNNTSMYTFYSEVGSENGLIHECSTAQYNNFYDTAPDQSRTYYCVDKNDGIKSNIQNGYISFINIIYAACKDIPDSRSSELDQWVSTCNKTIDKSEKFKLDLKLIYTDISESTLERTNKTFIDSQEAIHPAFHTVKLKFINKAIIDNVNRFGYEEKTEQSYILDNIKITVHNSGYKVTIELIGYQQSQLKLVYDSLAETIARIIAMYNLLTIIVLLFHKFIFKYSYYSYILSMIMINQGNITDKEDLNDFNFCNYLLSSIPLLCNILDRINRFKAIESNIVSFLSVERILMNKITPEIEMGVAINNFIS
jgi:hypothetical protein